MADPFSAVTIFLCKVLGYINGPVGFAVVLVMVAVGGLAMAVGSRQAMSFVIGALVGAAIILGARMLVSLLGPQNLPC